MAAPNYAKMFPKSVGTIPAGVNPSAYAVAQAQAQIAKSHAAYPAYLAAHPELTNWWKGNPAYDPSAIGFDPARVGDTSVRYLEGKLEDWNGLPKEGSKGTLPYAMQRAYDQMVQNEKATYGKPTYVPDAGLPIGWESDARGVPYYTGNASATNPRFGKVGTPFDPLRGTPEATAMVGGGSDPALGGTPSPAPVPAPTPLKPTIVRQEVDPMGSLYDAFRRSLNQATMPPMFRANWS